jgi:hypothetical protein
MRFLIILFLTALAGLLLSASTLFSPPAQAHTNADGEIAFTSQSLTQPPTPAPTPGFIYTFSGRVTDGASGDGIAGVTIALVGDRTGTQIARTNESGNYSITYGPNNKITLTASKTGYLFSPLVSEFISNADLRGNWTVSFTASQFPIFFSPPPVLLTEENSLRGLVLDSVTFVRDPFPVVTSQNFSSDRHSRVMLFAVNVDLRPGENASTVTAQAEDSTHRIYPLPVESVGKVPGYDWLTQVVVKLPDELGSAGDVSVSINFRSATSNKVLVRMKP